MLLLLYIVHKIVYYNNSINIILITVTNHLLSLLVRHIKCFFVVIFNYKVSWRNNVLIITIISQVINS